MRDDDAAWTSNSQLHTALPVAIQHVTESIGRDVLQSGPRCRILTHSLSIGAAIARQWVYLRLGQFQRSRLELLDVRMTVWTQYLSALASCLACSR